MRKEDEGRWQLTQLTGVTVEKKIIELDDGHINQNVAERKKMTGNINKMVRTTRNQMRKYNIYLIFTSEGKERIRAEAIYEGTAGKIAEIMKDADPDSGNPINPKQDK